MRRILSALACVSFAACGSVAPSRFTFGAISGGMSPRPVLSIEIPREFRPDKQRPNGYPSDIEVHRWSRIPSQSIELSYCVRCPPKREEPDMWLSIDDEAIEVGSWRTTLQYGELVRPDNSTAKMLHVYLSFGESHFRVAAEGLSKSEFRQILRTVRIAGKEPNKTPEPTPGAVTPRAPSR